VGAATPDNEAAGQSQLKPLMTASLPLRRGTGFALPPCATLLHHTEVSAREAVGRFKSLGPS